MSKFIDVHHLDSVNPNNIYCNRELNKFQRFSMLYRCHAAEFIIRNNVFRHNVDGRVFVFRIAFKDIWPWHISEEIKRIVGLIIPIWFTDMTSQWDCLWILKSSPKSLEDLLFCDIIFFGDEDIPENKMNEVLFILNHNQECIEQASLIIPGDEIRQHFTELQNLCIPTGRCQILQCEFAHDIVP